MDRALGYGLKYDEAFTHTQLGIIRSGREVGGGGPRGGKGEQRMDCERTGYDSDEEDDDYGYGDDVDDDDDDLDDDDDDFDEEE